MTALQLTGNVTPPTWFKTITYRTKRGRYPHLLAVNILSEIVYWYRPKVIRNEAGAVTGYEKRFKGNMLERSTADLADHFGVTAEQVRDALALLQYRGIVHVYHEHHGRHLAGNKLTSKNWRQLIDIDVNVLRAYTWPSLEAVEEFDTVAKVGNEYAPIAALEATEKPAQKFGDGELTTGKPFGDGELTNLYNTETTEEAETTISFPNGKPVEPSATLFSQPHQAPKPKRKKAPARPPAERKVTLTQAGIPVFFAYRRKFLELNAKLCQEVTEADVRVIIRGKEGGNWKNLVKWLVERAKVAGQDYSNDPQGFCDNVLTPFFEGYLRLGKEWFAKEFLPSNFISHFNRITDAITKLNAAEAAGEYTGARRVSEYDWRRVDEALG